MSHSLDCTWQPLTLIDFFLITNIQLSLLRLSAVWVVWILKIEIWKLPMASLNFVHSWTEKKTFFSVESFTV